MSPVAITRQGKVEGAEEGGLSVFKGIPFAQPPVGKLRFRPPQAPSERQATYDATRFRASAPQHALAAIPGMDIGETSEDCLYLNVWTPGLDGAKRPVMVWIHGGGFITGAGSIPWYSGAKLATKGDVVVVTINYRLGALGFMHLADAWDGAPETSGANGILDQVAALAWVRDNIEEFGGDPDQVTIFGESAGAMSTAIHLGLPQSNGLFSKAILQSGSGHALHTREQAAKTTEQMLRALGLEKSEASKVVDLPPEALLDGQAAMVDIGDAASTSDLLPFLPAIDGEAIKRPPMDEVADGLSKNVPVITGTNVDEFNLFAPMDPQLSEIDREKLLRRVERIVESRIPGGGEKAPEIVERYEQALEERGATDPKAVWQAIASDFVFRIPSIRLAEAQSEHQPETFKYLFTWESPAMGGILKCCHALEIPFVFGALEDPIARMFAGDDPAVDQISAQMQDAWLSFARTGKPEAEGMGDWPAYDSSRRATMLFGAESRVQDDPLHLERKAWEGVF